jgi:hypothetical protein
MESLLENYINSFDLSKLKIWEALHKVLKNLAFKKDFIIIDKFSKIFSKIYLNHLESSGELHQFNSENAVYMFVFILILLDIDFKFKGKANLIKESVNLIDYMILLKYLNEGLNFEAETLKESYKYVKLIGLTNINTTQFFLTKYKLNLSKDDKVKSIPYRYSISDEWIMLFNIKTDVCEKLIYFSNKTLYKISLEERIKTVTISSNNEKKNVLIFKHKNSYVKYNKYTKLTLKLENFLEVKKIFEFEK